MSRVTLRRQRVTIPLNTPLDERTSEKLVQGMTKLVNVAYDRTGKAGHRPPLISTGESSSSEDAAGIVETAPGQLAVLELDGPWEHYQIGGDSSYSTDNWDTLPLEVADNIFVASRTGSLWSCVGIADDPSSPSSVCVAFSTRDQLRVQIYDADTFELIGEPHVTPAGYGNSSRSDPPWVRVTTCEDTNGKVWFVVGSHLETSGDGFSVSTFDSTDGSAGSSQYQQIDGDTQCFDVDQSEADATVFAYALIATTSSAEVDMGLCSVSTSGTVTVDSSSTGVWTSPGTFPDTDGRHTISVTSIVPASEYWSVAWSFNDTDEYIAHAIADDDLGTTTFPSHPVTRDPSSTGIEINHITQFLTGGEHNLAYGRWSLTLDDYFWVSSTNGSLAPFSTNTDFDTNKVATASHGVHDTTREVVYFLEADGWIYAYPTPDNDSSSDFQTVGKMKPICRISAVGYEAGSAVELINLFQIGANKFGVIAAEPILNGFRAKLSVLDLAPSRRTCNVHTGGQAYLFGGEASTLYSYRRLALSMPKPPDGSVAESASSGNLGAGTYSYAFIWEFTDELGQIHRSGPSFDSVTLAGPSDAVDVTVEAPLASVYEQYLRCAIYRTEADGSVYHYVGQSITWDDGELASETSKTIVEDLTDSNLSDNTILYTQGGEFESQAPPPLEGVIEHRNRLFGIDQTDRSKIWPTKQKAEGVVYEFNENLAFFVPNGDEVTGLASTPSGLVLFTKNSLYLVSGDGPNNTGSGGSFGIPRPIWSRSLGCIDWRSVVQTPSGVFFQSQRGIELLTPSLQVQFVGAQIQETLGDSLVDTGFLDPERQLVTFSLQDSNSLLIYDLLEQKWGEWDFDGGNSGDRHRDFLYASRLFQLTTNTGTTANWTLNEYDPDTSSGDSSDMVIDTPWIKVAGIAGFQRLYKIYVLGDYVGAGGHTVRIYYDYDESTSESVSQSEDTTPYLFEVYPMQQRCHAFKLRIRSNPSASGQGSNSHGINLDAIVCEVGVDSHLYHLNPTRADGA